MSQRAATHPPELCARFHRASELIGRRWTGAIVAVLLDHGPMRFSEIAQAVPELSDRLLSERMKELEARGIAFIGPIRTGAGSSWSHFRAPDGHVYELTALPGHPAYAT